VKGLIGRRAVFFLVVAIMCALLIPAAPAEFRWVNLVMIGIALFWTIMLAGEDLARRRARSRRRPPGVEHPG